MNRKIIPFVATTVAILATTTSPIFAMPPPAPSHSVPMKTDLDIATAVRSAFAADKFTKSVSTGISVQVENGVATLSGTVTTERAKSDLGAKARSVGGVKQVINDIQVAGSTTTPPAIAPRTK